jgi:hypothetical protein
MFQSQKNHKAKHGGYYDKPSNKAINNLMSMYGDCLKVGHLHHTNLKSTKVGTQLKLKLI